MDYKESKAMVELANGTATPDGKTHLLSKDDYDKTKQVISVLVELLETFGFDARGYKPSDAVKVWAPHVHQIGWMKWAKYKIAAYFSYHNNQILPKQPTSLPDNAGDLLTGKACRFMRNYLRRFEGDSSEDRLERASFLTSVLQSKKGMPRPDEAALEKSKMETFKTLTTYTPPKRYAEVDGKVIAVERTDSENRLVDFELIVEEVRRTTTELFRGVKFDPSRDINSVMPSLSANYNRTRSRLGTLGHLQDNGDLDVPLEEQVLPEFDITYHHLEEYVPDDRTSVRSAKTGSSVPLALIYQPEESRKASGEPPTTPFLSARFLSQDRLKHRFNTVFYRALRKAQEEDPLVELVSLPEALKVRTISKGPPYTYYVLKQVQKFMWSVLKDHPVFALIGQTVDADILNSVIGGMLSDGLGYLSGDYKAATDNLRGELSEAAWLTFCEVAEVPNALAVLGLRALTGHAVQDPESGTVLEQQAGQLMGSIISFPILCIVNAAVCRLSLEIDNCKQLSLGRRTRGGIWRNVPRLLINGDDCLFVVTERGRKVWGAVAQLAGLEESIGKVYYARDFANVNSTNFIRVYDSFTQVPYVNLGLLFGYKRSGGQASHVLEADFDLGARQRELFELSGHIRDGVLWQHFKKHNASSLDFYSKLRIPWFVPKEYGGVGLLPVKELDVNMSREDQMICRAMIQRTFPHAPRPRIMKDHVELMLHEQVLEITERVLGYRAQKSYSLQKVNNSFDVTGLYLYMIYCMPDWLKPQDTLFDESSYQHELLAQNAKVWSYYWKRLDRCPPPFTEGLQARYPVHDVALFF